MTRRGTLKRRPDVSAIILAVAIFGLGATRFITAGILPAFRDLRGDFGASFPTSYFAQWRPDFPTDQVWAGWNYGPMFHFLTTPLLALPDWSMVAPAWAMTNLILLGLSFALTLRLSGSGDGLPRGSVLGLAGLWLLYQPLVNCLAQGNIEILELALILSAIASLSWRRGYAAGALLGVASMIKILPIGWLAWCAVRRQWGAFQSGIVVIGIILMVTTVTLGWGESLSIRAAVPAVSVPISGLHEVSLTSAFGHRAGLLDIAGSVVRWFPIARAESAAFAGTIASLLLAVVFGLLLVRRRLRPVSPFEVGMIFIAMFMVLPWNHDYYYIFAIVPFSFLALGAMRRRAWLLLAGTLGAYVLISPPVPFGLVDRTGLFAMSFAYVLNFYDVPVVGGMLLWFLAAGEMLRESGEPVALGPWPVRRVLLVLGASSALVTAAVWHSRPTVAQAPVASAISFNPPILRDGPTGLAVSEDGSRIAYIASVNGMRLLCARELENGATMCPPSTADATGPSFSPDGSWIAFFSGPTIKRMHTSDGGRVEIVGTAEGGHSAAWAHDDTVLFASAAGIVRMRAFGAQTQATEIVVPVVPGSHPYSSPLLMPGGDVVLYTVIPRRQAPTIEAFSLKTRSPIKVIEGSQPRFDRKTRRLVYMLGGRVLAVPFDERTLRVTDVSVPLVADAQTTAAAGTPFDVSQNGMLVYASATPVAFARKLAWVDRAGAVVPLSVEPNAFEMPRLSSDGRTLAVVVRTATTDVWTHDLSDGRHQRLTFDGRGEIAITWGFRSGALAFVSPNSELTKMVITPGALNPASVEVDQLWPGASLSGVHLTSWSQDGRVLAGTRDGNVWLLVDAVTASKTTAAADGPPAGGHPGQRVISLQTSSVERHPTFSPDGRWLSFTSNASGRDEVYVQAIPALDAWLRVSSNGGAEPVWSRDGRQLFFRQGDSIMAVDVDLRFAFRASTAQQLFDGPFVKGDRAAN